MAPDERALRAALESAAFQSGVDGGRWRLVDVAWPIGSFAVTAAARPNSPSEYGLRIDLSGYPQQPPTATPWDLELDARLTAEKRPKGFRAERVFRTDWEEGRALYAPWDRVALSGHSAWLDRHPEDAWHPERDIAFFLGRVHELLNADDYTGV
ncbi:MAG: hypothetical protein OXF61_00195 [Acidimicrobiaceae bacterium]|nr:hypothetical protein [Acidimicrobiaceae bacterium]MCY3947599.1 hypothetical protein [Acidimicrobiaceae bacterium]